MFYLSLNLMYSDTNLIHVYELPLQISCCWDDRFHGPHTKVVVVLWAKLFWCKLKCWYYLLGKVAGMRESKGEQTDLCNQGIVWYHHSYWSEQSLSIYKYKTGQGKIKGCVSFERSNFKEITCVSIYKSVKG